MQLLEHKIQFTQTLASSEFVVMSAGTKHTYFKYSFNIYLWSYSFLLNSVVFNITYLLKIILK